MNLLAQRALRIGAMVVVLGIGALVATQSRLDGLAEAYVAALTVVSLICLALAGRAGSPTPAPATIPEQVDSKATRQAQDQMIDAALRQIIDLIKEYIVVNLKYNDDLSTLNDKLLQLPSADDVRDIIVKLVGTNLAMQAKVTAMAKELEASQLQIVSLTRNISEVGKIALLDALTELGNRRFFDQTLVSEVARARETGAGLCLAMADLDRFKSINDRFGHVVGDQLLKLFAGVLTSHLRGPDMAARYGGEEFTILFPGAGLDAAVRIVEKIRRDIESRKWVVGPKEERLGAITASFGVARLAIDESAESFVRRADAKLFAAKSAGRNRVAVDRPGQNLSHAAVLTD